MERSRCDMTFNVVDSISVLCAAKLPATVSPIPSRRVPPRKSTSRFIRRKHICSERQQFLGTIEKTQRRDQAFAHALTQFHILFFYATDINDCKLLRARHLFSLVKNYTLIYNNRKKKLNKYFLNCLLTKV